MAGEHLLVVGWGVGGKGGGIEKSSETSQFVFEELHLYCPETHTMNRTRYLKTLI